jgi:hypothetical protein
MPSPPKNVINKKHVGGRGRGTTISWTNYGMGNKCGRNERRR